MNHPLNELALFAGAGGGILGGKLLGWRTICAVEWDAYARDVLVARQNDGCLEAFPIWDDVQTFDGTPWRGSVDVVSGGFPCQDISSAGKGAGIDGERSGMWKQMARICGEIRPRFIFVENSPMLVGRGLAVVLGDLAEMGYDAEWGIVGARDAAAPHKRERIWIVANAASTQDDAERGNCEFGWNAMGRSEQAAQQDHRAPDHNSPCGCCGHVAHSQCGRLESRHEQCARQTAIKPAKDGWHSRRMQHGETWRTEPDVGRVAYGVAFGMDRLRCIGNGQVPAVVPLAWSLLSQMNAQDQP